MSALELEWVFGINTSITNCVHLLENNDKNEQIIFYPVSNYGVIYNINTSKQTFLNAHTNIITSSIISSNKQLLILGDSGASNNNKSIISIWNSSTTELIATYELPPNFGTQCLAINPTNNFLSAIVNESIQLQNNTSKIVQHLIVWSLPENPENSEQNINLKLLSQVEIKNQQQQKQNLYHFITFNHNSTEIVTHSNNINDFIFWSIKTNEDTQDIQIIPYYTKSVDNINNIDLTQIGELTESAFIPIHDGPLITATNNGDLIIWDYDDKKSNKLQLTQQKQENDGKEIKHRIINKIISKITRGSINCVDILHNNSIIVLASSAGSVRFYDFEFRVIGWLDYLGDQVISISFPLNIPKYNKLSMNNLENNNNNEENENNENNQFVVPNMIIGTKNNKIIRVKQAKNNLGAKHEVIIDTFNIICTSMSSHPALPYVAIGTQNGQIQIWDMVNKQIIKNINLSQPQQITNIQFSPNGEWMVFGTDSHYLRIYDTQQFTEHQVFKTNYDGNIGNLCFSFNGEWMAFSQSNRISVYRFWYNINDLKKEKPKEWVLIGNYISHHLDIIDLHFAIPSGIDSIQQRNIPRLYSIGYDKLLNEYDLRRSSANFGLRIKYTFQLLLPQKSLPTTIQFIPGIKLNNENLMTYSIENEENNEDILAPKYDEIKGEWVYTEDRLIIFDDELKLHFYYSPRSFPGQRASTSNTQTLTSKKTNDTDKEKDKEAKNEEDEEEENVQPLQFRRTVLGPAYGAPIKKIIGMENGDGNTFLYCTYDQIIGLIQGPFNGNPYRYFGCNGHPGKINGFECILNNKYLITNGGYDKSLLVWKINKDILSEQIIECDEMENLNNIYKNMLYEEDENLYEEIKNYFYFVEIEDQGSISTVPRNITKKINIKQITKIFQAMGCFLSINDIERINKEIIHRFGNHININNHNQSVNINLEQFIEIFINYRSTFEISMDDLHKTFMNIVGIQQQNENDKNKLNEKEKQQQQLEINIEDLSMTREFFMDILQKKGDKMSRDELMNCLCTLTGYSRKQLKGLMPTEIDASFFIQNILGLKRETN